MIKMLYDSVDYRKPIFHRILLLLYLYRRHHSSRIVHRHLLGEHSYEYSSQNVRSLPMNFHPHHSSRHLTEYRQWILQMRPGLQPHFDLIIIMNVNNIIIM